MEQQSTKTTSKAKKDAYFSLFIAKMKSAKLAQA
jgi:hypothetical protein